MIATFLTIFFALVACQALLVVKLADWLTPKAAAGRGTVVPARSAGTVSLA